jgi:peptidyl-prolyl cis-trans isomerase SurA
MRRVLSLTALALAAWAGTAAAQEDTAAQDRLPQDRIMAVVGDNILLLSEWRDQALVLATQVGIQPGTPEFRELATESFRTLLDDLIILTAAQRDTTVQVSEDEVLEAVDREVAEIRQRFPTEEEFQRQLAQSQWGSLSAYRGDLQERKRRELVGQAFIEAHQSEIQFLPVSDEEVQAAWERSREQLGTTPVLIRFEEIPIPVIPGDEAREKGRAEAQRIKDDLLAGNVEFGAAASQYSDDESNREDGGDLGWFGRGRMVPAFEAAAYAAALGEIVGPVETVFGMHLIQVIDQRGEEIRARHILIAYEFGQEDRDRARAEADSMRDLVLAGADVDSLQTTAMPGDSAAAEVLEFAERRLPEAYAQALRGIEPGGAAVVETATGYSVVIARGAAGGEAVTFEQAAPQIRQQLAQQKAEEAFVTRLREQVFVEVRIQPEDVLGTTG